MDTSSAMDDLMQAIDEFQTPLLRYARQILRHQPDTAQDVVQEAFIRLHHALHTEKPIGKLKPWLYRVTHNLAIDTVRRSAKSQSLETTTIQEESAAPTEAHQDSRAIALAELHNLPDDVRQVLLLKILENHTLQEVADVTGVPLSTVNYRLAKGLRMLANVMQDKGVTYP